MFQNDVSHNLQFKMAAPSWYISVHDGRHNVLGMYTDSPSKGLHLQHEGLACRGASRLTGARYKGSIFGLRALYLRLEKC